MKFDQLLYWPTDDLVKLCGVPSQMLPKTTELSESQISSALWCLKCLLMISLKRLSFKELIIVQILRKPSTALHFTFLGISTAAINEWEFSAKRF